ncbi:hypothetical protein RhiLY_01983 [Ceratobasidium sp. AG-Ba]|nr:hypothetical protein RhiLY_01983 [Ceratobasidium sp. AG-Ba]
MRPMAGPCHAFRRGTFHVGPTPLTASVTPTAACGLCADKSSARIFANRHRAIDDVCVLQPCSDALADSATSQAAPECAGRRPAPTPHRRPRALQRFPAAPPSPGAPA